MRLEPKVNQGNEPSSRDQPIARPIIWAMGRQGRITQLPLSMALSLMVGAELEVIASQRNAELDRYRGAEFRLTCLPIPRLSDNPFRSLSAYLTALRGLRRRLAADPALIHVVMLSPYDLLYLPFLPRRHAKVLMTVHDATRHPGDVNFAVHLIAKLLFARADCFVTLTRFVRDMFLRGYKTEKPVHVVANGIVNHIGLPHLPRAFPAGRPLKLLFIGRIVRYKGIDLLLEAARLLRQQQMTFELTLAGSGDLSPYAAAIAAVSPRIVNGWISDEQFTNLLAEHDVAVLPYREASQSGVAYHAINAALPVVATRAGGLAECLHHGINALLAEPTPAAIAAALEEMMTSPGVFETLSLGAHEKSKELTPAATARLWLALYRNEMFERRKA